MAQNVGTKLAGAMNRSPSLAGLRRVSAGIYRDAQGQLVGANGKPVPRQPMPPQQPSFQGGMGTGVAQGIGTGLGQHVNPGPGVMTKPAIIPGQVGMGPAPYQLGVNPTLDKFKQEYDAAVNYQPDFKESQSPNDMGFLQRKVYADMAQRRQQLINSPIGRYFAAQGQAVQPQFNPANANPADYNKYSQ